MSKLDPKVQAVLDANGIRHEVLACDPNFADTTAFCEKYDYDPAQAANTILVASKKGPEKYVACVVLANTRLDVNKKVCELMGVKRASFASGEQTQALSGMMIGGVTVFGLPTDVPVYVDQAVTKQPTVIMGGGNRNSKLLIDPKELTKLPQAQIVSGLATPRSLE